FNSQIQFFSKLTSSKLKGQKLGSYIKRLLTFIIPIFIIILFVIIYRNSNPVFDKLVENSGVFFQEKLSFIFEYFDFPLVTTFLISLIISVFIFIRTSDKRLIQLDLNSSEELKRNRQKTRKGF